MSSIKRDAATEDAARKPVARAGSRVGIDVGGTFTDFVLLHEGSVRIHKISTTTDDQSRAVVAGLQALQLDAAQIVHGMTVATNALLERKGARTALLTTLGFGDVLTIGRQNRPHLYRLQQERPPSLIADGLQFEVAERVDASGAVIEPLDEVAIHQLAQALAAARAESLAICFLFSFRNAAHEERAAAILRQYLPDLPISLSSAILPEYREYERTATTVINAYVQPLVTRYLTRLEAALDADRPKHDKERRYSVRIMQSNGGAMGIAQAQHEAARLVLSGPAGGVVGAFAVAEAAMRHLNPDASEEDAPVRLLTFDMGGTSTDVALCPGAIPTTAESTIGELPLRLPIIDIHTVGAGGGSIARVDAGGALRVGPESAGAQPGPAAYGRGGDAATVTDANLVLGRLDPAGFLGGAGDVALDAAAARRVLADLAAELGMTGETATETAALGVLRVANATMERALRRVSVERGHDARDFTLLPFGGAGPLHACDLAELLHLSRILIPPFPGVLSAYGMLAATVSSDASRSVLQAADLLICDAAPLEQACAEMTDRLRAVLREEGVSTPRLSLLLDMRYRGQSYELSVNLALPITGEGVEDARTAFHATHAQRYGYAMPEEAVEVVTLRVRADAPGAPLGLRPLPLQGAEAAAARTGTRAVWFAPNAPEQTAVYARALLQPGNRIAGPALITQYDSTTLLAPGWHATVDAFLNLLVERGA